MDRARLFVYGTLQSGLANAAHMATASFERVAATSPGHSLYDLGPYPALVVGGEGVVMGELYRLSREDLARLDEFEGCPDLYQRAEIVLEDGTRAMAYVMSPERVLGLARIPGGDFAAYLRSRPRTADPEG